jgi:hypothetical protein
MAFLVPSIQFFFALPRALHLDEGIFYGVRRLPWCNIPESYAGGSEATGRATLAGQVKREHPDKERYTGPPGWGLGRWASTPSPGKKNTHAKKTRQRLGKKKGRSYKDGCPEEILYNIKKTKSRNVTI